MTAATATTVATATPATGYPLESVFGDLIDVDETGEVYLYMDNEMPTVVEEAQAVEVLGDYLSYVYYEAGDRLKGQVQRKREGKRLDPTFLQQKRPGQV